jgi:D-alanyl-D-alanine carboxypeptidase
VVVGAVGLVLLTATVLAGLKLAPRAAGTAHPVDSRSAQPPDDPPRLPDDPRQGADDPRLRDDRVDPFDDTHPAIAGLRAGLRDALQDAARDAEAQGVEVWVTSGWRSAAYQQELLDQAVQRYGSLSEALRYVAAPDTSSHVTGDAVDLGPTEADDWMIRHGAEYGLCQTYANELWHFQLATEPGGSCPAPRPDAAG